MSDEQPVDENGRKICGSQRTDGSGKICKKDAGAGTDHVGWGRCKHHLGATPMVSKAAYRAMAAAMGDPEEIDPATAIARTISQTAGHVTWLHRQIAGFKLPEGQKIGEDGVETIVGMTPNQAMWWKVYGEERDRLVKMSEVALRAGLAKRQLDLAVEQGERLANAVDRILSGLGLTQEQLNRVPDVVPAALAGMVIDMPAIEAGGGGE